MAIWRSEKGSALDVVSGALQFTDRKGVATPLGPVRVDCEPAEAPAKLAGLIDGAPGRATAFFAARKFGWSEAFCELFPLGEARTLLLVRERKPDHWYSMPLTRTLLVEAGAAAICERLCAEAAPDVLTVKSPTTGTFAHGAQVGPDRFRWGAWVGEELFVTDDVDGATAPAAEAYRSALRGSIDEARTALTGWVLDALRAGHAVTTVELRWDVLALPKDKLAELVAAVSVKVKPARASKPKR
jgi:hypothetical protein